MASIVRVMEALVGAGFVPETIDENGYLQFIRRRGQYSRVVLLPVGRGSSVPDEVLAKLLENTGIDPSTI